MFKKLFFVFLVLSIVLSPVFTFAQQDDFNSNDYLDTNYGGGTTTNSNSTNSGSSASAVGCSLANDAKLQDLFTYANCIINRSIIPLLFTLATLFFLWGVVQYMLADANESKRETGKQYMVWGIIALTVMLSVWGLVNLLGNTFGLDTGFVPQVSPN